MNKTHIQNLILDYISIYPKETPSETEATRLEDVTLVLRGLYAHGTDQERRSMESSLESVLPPHIPLPFEPSVAGTEKLEQIEAEFLALGLPYQRQHDCLVSLLSTDRYLNTKGDLQIQVVLSVFNQGRDLKVLVPNLYQATDPDQSKVLFKACLVISSVTQGIQYELLPRSGEVQLSVEAFLEDNVFTAYQLKRCFDLILATVDEFDSVLRDPLRLTEADQFEEICQRAKALPALVDSEPLHSEPQFDLGALETLLEVTDQTCDKITQEHGRLNFTLGGPLAMACQAGVTSGGRDFFVSVDLFHAPLSENETDLIEACMFVSLQTQGLQFEYHPGSRWVSLSIEQVIEGNPPTVKQISRILYEIRLFAKVFLPRLEAAANGAKLAESPVGYSELSSQLEAELNTLRETL